eukprot:TRINITY_DN13734_c0_g1_i1.p1 TRINITY_DN13734_c0_g1~~TRINITY_DN13734_c0_g1_i1.p1  ORF type:complete len:234 (+),score=29.65 TRINITY_DN13734_c0_g1_i1:51-704(+)
MERPAREESLPAIKRLFDILDVNHDGLIDFDDARTIMKQLGLFPPMQAIRQMIAAVDAKKDLVIDFDEFTAMRRGGGCQDINVIAEFKRFDVDDIHRGFLTPDSIRRVLKAEGYAAEEAAAYVGRLMSADADNDGKVSFRDLHNLLTRRIPIEWAEWVSENLARGVADTAIYEILQANGFESERAVKLVADTKKEGHAVAARSFADTSCLYVYTLRS